MRLSVDLQGLIPPSLLPLVPDRFEVIGDIAVISLPEPVIPYREVIAGMIMSRRKSVRTVLRRVSKREGDKRVALYEPVIGSRTTTTCRESGFSYQVDLAHAFFTTRLSGERQRITSLVQPEERIIVPFAGVGPFVIPPASKGAHVTALEMNPFACRLLTHNIRKNRLRTAAVVIQGDALTADSLFSCRFDRAIIPTPYGLDEAFFPIDRIVRPGGMLHYYTFMNRTQAFEKCTQFCNAGYSVTRCHRCGNVAPSVSRWVFDLVKGI